MTLRQATSSALLAAALLLPVPVSAATITIVNLDGAGEGFNDPTPVAPVGGNPGVTLGQQRLNVFQQAAAIWGSILPSAVEIRVQARFDPIVSTPPCNATSGVLGSASPLGLAQNFPGAPIANTLYTYAEANKLAGFDLDGVNNDINTTFNTDVDNATCLGATDWYYGFDSNEGSDIELLPVVLHELGHGLGFTSQVNLTSGAFPSGIVTVYARFLRDNTTGKQWDVMTPAERVASAVNNGNVVWTGAATTAAAPSFLSREPRLTVNAPLAIAGNYLGGAATFGPPLGSPGVTAPVVLAADGVVGGAGGTVNDACEALTNGALLAGKIALVDRGFCNFTAKAAAVQAAGAVGMIVANNVAGAAPSLGGTDASIVIPAIGISQADGNTLKANLVGLNATLTVHPTQLLGSDVAGRLRVYAPNPVQSGSSISHWDVVATPNLLMEPALGSDLISAVDITRHQMRDIGWFTGSSVTAVPERRPVAVELRSRPNPWGTSTAVSFELGRAGGVELDVFTVDGRHVRRLVGTDLAAGPHSVVWDGRDAGGRRMSAGVYLFRLRTDEFTAGGRTVRLD